MPPRGFAASGSQGEKRQTTSPSAGTRVCNCDHLIYAPLHCQSAYQEDAALITENKLTLKIPPTVPLTLLLGCEPPRGRAVFSPLSQSSWIKSPCHRASLRMPGSWGAEGHPPHRGRSCPKVGGGSSKDLGVVGGAVAGGEEGRCRENSNLPGRRDLNVHLNKAQRTNATCFVLP